MTPTATAIASACEATAVMTRASSAFISRTISSGVSSSSRSDAGLRPSVSRWSMSGSAGGRAAGPVCPKSFSQQGVSVEFAGGVAQGSRAASEAPHGGERLASEAALLTAGQRVAEPHQGVARPGERPQVVPDAAVRQPLDEEALFALLDVAGQGAVGEAEPALLVDGGDDPGCVEPPHAEGAGEHGDDAAGHERRAGGEDTDPRGGELLPAAQS